LCTRGRSGGALCRAMDAPASGPRRAPPERSRWKVTETPSLEGAGVPAKMPKGTLNSILFAGMAAALLAACVSVDRQTIRGHAEDGADRPSESGGSPGGVSSGSGSGSSGGRMPGDAGFAPSDAGARTRNPGRLGQPCFESSDCGALLRCVTTESSDFGGDGVANGFCTLDCTGDLLSQSPAESVCAVLDPTAVCLEASFDALCTETCEIGANPIDKCSGRNDFACSDPKGFGGHCVPSCRGDFDCSGRRCDLGTGTCRDRIEPGRTLPIGAKCDPDAAVDRCEGACVVMDDGPGTPATGFCSGYCSLGSELNCNVDPLSTDPVPAFCLYGASEGSDFGDLGFCGQLCDCNEDCSNLDFVCSPVAGLDRVAGRMGACGPPSTASGSPVGIPCR
jgi:hypothetical protein